LINDIKITTSKYEFIAMKSRYLEEQLAQLVLAYHKIKPSEVPPGRCNYWKLETLISKDLTELNKNLDSLYHNSKLTKIAKYKERLAILQRKQAIIEVKLFGEQRTLNYDNLYLTDIVYSDLINFKELSVTSVTSVTSAKYIELTKGIEC